MAAVHKDQLSWDKDIPHRPAQLDLLERPPATNVSAQVIEHLEYNGKILVDIHGEPLRDFSTLPLVISSKVEGWRVEAWLRSDTRIAAADIVARIPVKLVNNAAGEQTQVPEYSSATLRERARKYRVKAGLVCWDTRIRNIDLSYDFDCREERPENPEEIQAVQDALQRTYDDFEFHTSGLPTGLDHRDSYLDQWNSLQVQLQKMSEERGQVPPQLFALGKWTDSFENWVTAPRAYLNFI